MKATPQRFKTRTVTVIFCILLAVFSAASFSCSFANPLPEPDKDFYVYDEPGAISPETREHIVSVNDALFERTGGQIVTAVVRTTGNTDIADYAYDLFNSWKVGDSEKENGLLLLISTEEDDYWSVQGRGLEEILTSGELKLMLDTYLEPSFAKGDVDGGVRRFFDAAVRFYESAYSVSVSDAGGQGQAYEEPSGSGRAAEIFRAVKRFAAFCIIATVIIAAVAVALVLLGRSKPSPVVSRTTVPQKTGPRIENGYNFGNTSPTKVVYKPSGRSPGLTPVRQNTEDTDSSFDWSGFIGNVAAGINVARMVGGIIGGISGLGSSNISTGGSYRPTSPRSGTSTPSFRPSSGGVSRGSSGRSTFSSGSSGRSSFSSGRSTFSSGSSSRGGSVSRGGGGGGTRGGGAGRR